MASNIGILYVIEKNFSSRVQIWDRYFKIRLRLAKIINCKSSIARKCMPMIQAFSSETKGTILKRRLTWTVWDQEPPVEVTKHCHFEAVKFQLSHVHGRRRHTGDWATTELPWGFDCVWIQLASVCWQEVHQTTLCYGWGWGEKERVSWE